MIFQQIYQNFTHSCSIRKTEEECKYTDISYQNLFTVEIEFSKWRESILERSDHNFNHCKLKWYKRIFNVTTLNNNYNRKIF